jgi:hypothetical protein
MTKVYVVKDYDCICYAGTKLADAKKKVIGPECINIWKDGKLIGFVGYKNNKWYTHLY